MMEDVDGGWVDNPVDEIGFWNIAKLHPRRICCTGPFGTTVTYGQLGELADSVAAELAARGVEQHQVVATAMANGPDYLAVQLAVLQIGAILVPVDVRSSVKEAMRILADGEPRLLVCDECGAHIGTRACENPRGTGLMAMAEVPRNSTAASTAHRRRLAGEMLYYTSGTTGLPRGVFRRPVEGSPEDALRRWVPSQAENYGLRIGKGRLLCVLSFMHAGPGMAALRALHIGHTLVLSNPGSPEELLQLIQDYRITVFHAVPALFSLLLSLPTSTRARYDISSVTHIIHLGAKCPITIKRQMIEWFGPILHEVYASTEVGRTYVNSEDWLRRPGTVGRPVAGTSLKILDETGAECPPGVVGTVYLRQEGETFEYLNAPEETAACRRGDFVTIGDLGWVDEEGWLFLSDRRTALIICGGLNVSPAEIEEVLVDGDEIVAAAVVGAPHDVMGQVVGAIVEAGSGGWDQDVEQRLKRRYRTALARYKWPVHIVPAAVPRTAMGKVDRAAASKLYLEKVNQRTASLAV